MGRIRKEKSISKIFRIYIISFLIFIPLEIISLLALLTVSINAGIVRPANYFELVIRENRKEIESCNIEEIDKLIPEECIYAVFDDDENSIKTNVGKEKNSELLDAVKNSKHREYGYYYEIIQRGDEQCVIGYRIATSFYNKQLNKVLPNPEISLDILALIIFIAAIILFSKSFAKRISKEMGILQETTKNITMDNLDFEIKYSNIHEINEVLTALSKMKDELSNSLNKQWKKEAERKNQVGALAHDIKTPLTIIKGNAELLGELNLNSEQEMFNKNILNETSNIESYIKNLIQIMNSEKDIEINREPINLGVFIKEIIDSVSSLLAEKSLKLVTNIEDIPKIIYGDESSLKRAILNVISNGVDYSIENGEIHFSVGKSNESLIFIIEDSGRGFTKEEIACAKEEFYQGDKSRNAKNHYGMGLYIADNFIKKHNGNMILSNSEDLSGAKVTIKIPILYNE